ncbi:MAG: four helix bundle protein [Weeksellaceae bacterium]
MKTNNLIADKTFEFSLQIISLFIQLRAENEYVLSKQVLRSGTSIGANVSEAMAAQSKKDFINKMSIASKEARETKYWLRLLDQSELTNLKCRLI